MLFSPRLLHRSKSLLILALVWKSCSSELSYGKDSIRVAVGLSSIEEGDDRRRPGALVQMGLQSVDFRMHFYGFRMGPITRRSYLAAAGYPFSLFDNELMQASIGGSLLYENSSIKSLSGGAERSQINRYLGLFSGFYLKAPIDGLDLSAGWESFLFPAPGLAGILLSNSRRQALSIRGGWQF